MTHGKTYNKSPRRINYKATKSKTNTGITVERSVEQTTGGFKALLQLANFTLGPDATLNTEIHKNSVRIKAPNTVNASKRKHNVSSVGGNITKTCLFKYLKVLPPKNNFFQLKRSDIFHISAQNIDCGYSLEPPRRGGSYEYPQSLYLSRYKKKIMYRVNPSFTISKWDLRGSKLHRHVFVMNNDTC